MQGQLKYVDYKEFPGWWNAYQHRDSRIIWRPDQLPILVIPRQH